MTKVREDGQDQDELRVAHEPETEKCSSTHATFRVVQESVNTSIGKLTGNLLDEEEVGV